MYLTVAHPLSDLSHVLSVFPAGEHVGEGERLQTSVNQIRLLGFLLVLLWRGKLVHLFRPQKMLPRQQDFVMAALRVFVPQGGLSVKHFGGCLLETTFLR